MPASLDPVEALLYAPLASRSAGRILQIEGGLLLARPKGMWSCGPFSTSLLLLSLAAAYGAPQRSVAIQCTAHPNFDSCRSLTRRVLGFDGQSPRAQSSMLMQIQIKC